MVTTNAAGSPATGRLAGRSCVVTGAASGIGRAVAERFVREGASVVATDIDAEGLSRLADRFPGAVSTVVGDVADDADARRMIDAAAERHGRLDVLVANAGVLPLMEVTEATAEDWDHVMAVDGRGMFLTCKYAIQAMVAQERPGGSIVCLSSISGEAGQRGQAVYGPAKFVASGLTKHLAVEWAGRGIRVNAVAPGTITTERVARLSDEPGGPEYLAAIEKLHPMGRLGAPAEVAAAVLFLASDDASFITGAVLPVDGGYLAQ
ncbi:NAD(P)-dependent dehydrogenase (short-subunit alcohol dehydrogenase family) [Streptomyces sp. 1114.5]|uniref:SDR family NAD(P)-dependent oxidoreductase n=1 Tax=unclassified Streptomyces TaxID=2593676 RepID=UPI000BDB99C2|nr:MULTISPECIES: SDR family NAD(P)-dependent oxidoreductase [unclassified Streptomyces]RKT11524.1 NAD(P)-dependent dehydrogenase (short-subunit alcohol dehydrogenase family) [Streptomyces sp. 1114.5]SOB81037.1 NAD(P)-dependent dehydrogenase, short-chain alcohol dehydrogenase family [Streptomyces sp. 1331.2]